MPQSNVIPAFADLTLDVRVTPGIDADGLREELEALCRAGESACPGVKVEWSAINPFRLATRVDREEPLVQAMIGGVKSATGRAARYGACRAPRTGRS